MIYFFYIYSPGITQIPFSLGKYTFKIHKTITRLHGLALRTLSARARVRARVLRASYLYRLLSTGIISMAM